VIFIISFIISVLQIFTYRHYNRRDKAYKKSIILGLVLIANIFLFPSLLIALLKTNSVNAIKCWGPDLGIYFYFWFIGNGISLLIHYFDFISFKYKKEIASSK